MEEKYSSTREAFAEVGLDGRFDDFAGGLGHQAAHAAELTHLVDRAAGLAGRHHVDGVEIFEDTLVLGDVAGDGLAVVVAVVVFQAGHQVFGDLLAGVAPEVDQLGISLLIGDGADAVVLLDLVGLLLAFVENGGLGFGRPDVGDAEAEARQRATA